MPRAACQEAPGLEELQPSIRGLSEALRRACSTVLSAQPSSDWTPGCLAQDGCSEASTACSSGLRGRCGVKVAAGPGVQSQPVPPGPLSSLIPLMPRMREPLRMRTAVACGASPLNPLTGCRQEREPLARLLGRGPRCPPWLVHSQNHYLLSEGAL